MAPCLAQIVDKSSATDVEGEACLSFPGALHLRVQGCAQGTGMGPTLRELLLLNTTVFEGRSDCMCLL